MIGTTDKTVFTRLAEVLRKRIVTMIAAFGRLQKNKVNGKLGFSIMCQEFPIYLSLIVGYVYAMHLIVARHTYTVTFLTITRLPAISIRTNEKPVKAGRKNKNDTDRQKIAQPYGHGTWLHFLLAPRRGRTTGGSSFTPDICGGLGCHEQRKRKGGMNRPSVLLSTC